MEKKEEQMKREIRLDNLFLDYGNDRFLNWCRSLNIFRFCKSHPYPDDMHPDRFIAITVFSDDTELNKLLNIMKIKVKEKNSDKYVELKKIESTFSNLAKVKNEKCYIHINKLLGTLVLEVSGIESDPFSLDDSTFLRAKKIDEFISSLDVDFTSSPYDDDYCIAPEFYPEVWKR